MKFRNNKYCSGINSQVISSKNKTRGSIQLRAAATLGAQKTAGRER